MPSKPEHILENADIQWQDSGAPYSTRFDDIYFSRQGGLAETEHVFITGNALKDRWLAQDLAIQQGQSQSHTFIIGELGFGTGLNFLCTWRQWRTLAPQGLRLHYIACEKFPLRLDALRKALLEWPELTELSEGFLAQYPDHSHGIHRLHLQDKALKHSITLDLYYGDAEQLLSTVANRDSVKVDAWFLDGFAPKLNPHMWSETLLQQLARLSKAGTTLSTYSVAGTVVRGVRSAGFDAQKVKGFAQKRHMLIAKFQHASAQETANTRQKLQWLNLDPQHRSNSQRVIVIGAGLAGCAAAHSLARKGLQVLVLEQSSQIASGASGNRQAVLQCRLSNADSGNRQFNLQAFLYAVREFTQLQKHYPAINWQACGVLNLNSAFKAREERGLALNHDAYADKIVQALDQFHSNQQAGLAFDDGADFIPMGGYLNPEQLCHAYLQHPNIQLRLNSRVTHLEQVDKQWHVHLAEPGAQMQQSDAVLIANSHAAMQLQQTAALPIVPIRGQVSYLQANASSAQLQSVVCARSYISPPWQGMHSIGATYSKNISDLALSEEDHQQNLSGIAQYLASANLNDEAIRGGRVSIRATSTDRMPMVGPVPDFSEFETLFRSLGQRDRKNPNRTVPTIKGLYLSVSHGSHGLCNTPLSGEYIASLIANELLPIQSAIIKSIHPARFALRTLKRSDFSH